MPSASALRFAGEHRALPFDPAARERWIEIYPQLSAGQPGLAGAATARAEAHVVRLALIYALLDCSDMIGHRAPRGRARGLALQRRLRRLDLRRQPRRPDRRRDLGRHQGAPSWRDADRGVRHVQPQQETPRDRARPHSPRRRRPAATRDPPARPRSARGDLDAARWLARRNHHKHSRTARFHGHPQPRSHRATIVTGERRAA